MEKKPVFDYILDILSCAVIALFFFCLGKSDTVQLKREAVSLGYAHRNPTNGVWQWNEK